MLDKTAVEFLIAKDAQKTASDSSESQLEGRLQLLYQAAYISS